MAALRFSVFLFFLISGCSQAASKIEVTIENNLSSCIKLDDTEVVYNAGIPMLEISYQQLKAISQCGCKSAISQYSSQLEMEGYNSSLLTAKLIFEADKFNIPLATSESIIGDYNVLLSFSCAMPD